MRFQVILPAISVALAAILFRVGDIQVDKIVDTRRESGFVEPVPDSYARARYADYALNAPAWAALGEPPGLIWHRTTYWTGRDLRYLLALIAMWYCLGWLLDKKRGSKRAGDGQRGSGWRRALALLGVLYGLFLCYLMLPEFMVLHDKEDGFWLPHRRYELWFIAGVLVWGIGLILAGSHSLFHSSEGAQPDGG